MEHLAWQSIFAYCLFSVFVFYQQLHAKNFNGGSETFGLLLALSGFAGMLTGIAYLIYYGWSVVWWVPIVILILGFATAIPGYFLERLIGRFAISFLGFIAWPVCAYFMFSLVPNAT
ncbi:hypothetical protein HMPREF2130_10760 [Oligella urethralis DNF00040]|uniref:Uncharacterized protein n=1 Tax=Oligella urethralis DNF00040 TaxID=1401065 RepID=A0A095YUP0_9BURK|nr:hypothetical protein [Oligella urethralis]KGF25851.1 hypothetical protein HMPREF2130_10760 [Oligella urethralis DNF00040]SUA61236.1 Uncharacterised protein [Oligella urethralis]